MSDAWNMKLTPVPGVPGSSPGLFAPGGMAAARGALKNGATVGTSTLTNIVVPYRTELQYKTLQPNLKMISVVPKRPDTAP